MIDEVFKDCLESGYTIKVEKDGVNSVSMTVPENVVFSPVYDETGFSYEYDKCFKFKETSLGTEKDFDIPPYMVRPLILEDIIIKCFQSRVGINLVQNGDKLFLSFEDKQKLLRKLMDIELSAHEHTLEQLCFSMVNKTVNGIDCDDIVEKNDLQEEYDILNHLIDEGGFYA